MPSDFPITPVAHSRRGEVDYDHLGFGAHYADHMFQMIYADGEWRDAEIVPFGPISVHPANATLHYGQAVFEGLKAYRGVDDKVRIFRPEKNAQRLEQSCNRLCIPTIAPELFIEAIEALVGLDHAWIPTPRGQSLYVRPVVFSDEGHLEVRPSTRFRFLIFSAPVGAYFSAGMESVSLKAEQSYTRSAPGGVGYAKTAGNYGASLYPGKVGRDEGYAQVLWLDGIEHRYVEEVGAMNIFFRIDDLLVTPDLHGTILPGVTRDSVIKLLREAGYTVEERRIAIEEILERSRDGRLREVFGAGTAAVVCPVGNIAYGGNDYPISNGETGEVTRWLYDQITGIQHGEIPDRFDWCREVALRD